MLEGKFDVANFIEDVEKRILAIISEKTVEISRDSLELLCDDELMSLIRLRSTIQDDAQETLARMRASRINVELLGMLDFLDSAKEYRHRLELDLQTILAKFKESMDQRLYHYLKHLDTGGKWPNYKKIIESRICPNMATIKGLRSIDLSSIVEDEAIKAVCATTIMGTLIRANNKGTLSLLDVKELDEPLFRFLENEILESLLNTSGLPGKNKDGSLWLYSKDPMATNGDRLRGHTVFVNMAVDEKKIKLTDKSFAAAFEGITYMIKTDPIELKLFDPQHIKVVLGGQSIAVENRPYKATAIGKRATLG